MSPIEPEPAAGSTPFVCDLPHLAAIAAGGADARAFLDAQLSCDLHRLDAAHSLPGAWCTPQGRVIATVRVLERDGTLFLVLARDLLEPVLARLRRYVLRAQVSLEPAAERLALLGAYSAAAALAGAALPAAAGAVGRAGGCAVIRMPGVAPRYLLAGPAPAVAALRARAAKAGELTDPEPWRALDIAAGVAWVDAAASEQFLPQTLGLDTLGAVSFDKGCYPGQEVIARLKYRGGAQPRRLLHALAAAGEPPASGTAVYAAGDTAGQVLAAARAPGDGLHVLAVVRSEALGGAELRLGAADGPALQPAPAAHPGAR